MTNDTIEVVTRKKVAQVLPELLQATIDEYLSFIQKPNTETLNANFTKRQVSGKAAATHIIALLKLASITGIKEAGNFDGENMAKAILNAKQEFEKHRCLEISDEDDSDDIEL